MLAFGKPKALILQMQAILLVWLMDVGLDRLAFLLNTVAQEKSTLPCKDFTAAAASANPGDKLHFFQLHLALQSHLIILTGFQAGTASFRMICFFSCLSLPVSFLSQYFPGFVNKGLLCNMLLKLAFKSEILVLPTYSQDWLWVYNQEAGSRIIKVKTEQFCEDIVNPISAVLQEHPDQHSRIQLLLSAVLVGFRNTHHSIFRNRQQNMILPKKGIKCGYILPHGSILY